PDGPTMVISDGYWTRRFARDPNVIGRVVDIQQTPVRIVGVTPAGFWGVTVGWAFDVALPIRVEPAIRPTQVYDQDTRWLTIMLRLKRGQSLQSATTALRGYQPEIRDHSRPASLAQPDFLKDPFILTPVATGFSDVRTQYQKPLVALFI